MQAERNAPERKYALTKMAAGDYLLPANDGKTIWRIAKYTDGPSLGLDIPSDREFWALWSWTGEFGPDAQIGSGWEDWEMQSGLLDSRADAIAEALRLGEAK
jgi:hypothetical protein